MFAWEQYIYPPLHRHLATGDLLRAQAAQWDDPTGYRVVLTPTCDMVDTDGRTPNVSGILVAHCASTENLPTNKNKLEKVLVDQYDPRNFSTVLPPFEGLLPSMVANLRRLDIIELSDIKVREAEADRSYARVVSTDSPFRELIASHYLRVAGRAGLPDRNTKNWAEQITVPRQTA